MQPPLLTDAGLTLRAPTPADVDALVARSRDEEVRRWTSVPVPYGRTDAEAFVRRCQQGWRDGTACELALEVEGRNAGQVTLRLGGTGAADLGYVLAPWARGRGLASRAVRLLLAWGFAELGLEVVHWSAHVGNWASRRVAWSCGFVVEGRVRGWCEQRGERRDAWLGSIGRHDPRRPAARWLDVPELPTGPLVLRANRPHDVDRVVAACSDPVTQQWLPELPSPYTAADARWYLQTRPEEAASGTGVSWAVADAADDRLLGQIALTGLGGGSRSGEIGYWVHPDARGGGVMVRAVAAVARHALLDGQDGGLGLTRVHLKAAAGNTASIRVAERSGFTDCGVDRRAERLRDGTVQDFRRFDLLVEEMELAWAHPSALR